MKNSINAIKVYSPLAKTWSRFRPPVRPSQDDMDFYEKSIAGMLNKKTKVLILGVTPEIRDICAKYKLDVTLVDICPDMIESMGQLVKYKNTNEKIIKSDWLKMNFDQRYDLVIGDIVFNLFDLEDWYKFLMTIKKALKEKGVLLTRLMLDSPTRKKITIAQMIEEYKEGAEIGKSLDRTAVCLSDPDICGLETKKINYAVFNQKLQEFYKQGDVTSEEFDALKLLVASIPTIVPTKDYFKNFYSILSAEKAKELQAVIEDKTYNLSDAHNFPQMTPETLLRFMKMKITGKHGVLTTSPFGKDEL